MRTASGKRMRGKVARKAKKLARRITEEEIEAIREEIRGEERRKAEDIFIREADKIPRFLRRLFGCVYGHREKA